MVDTDENHPLVNFARLSADWWRCRESDPHNLILMAYPKNRPFIFKSWKTPLTLLLPGISGLFWIFLVAKTIFTPQTLPTDCCSCNFIDSVLQCSPAGSCSCFFSQPMGGSACLLSPVSNHGDPCISRNVNRFYTPYRSRFVERGNVE